MITDFTKLTRDQVAAILEDSGYGAGDIASFEYVSCKDGKLRYAMKAEDGETIIGNVYISIGKDGKFEAELDFLSPRFWLCVEENGHGARFQISKLV